MLRAAVWETEEKSSKEKQIPFLLASLSAVACCPWLLHPTLSIVLGLTCLPCLFPIVPEPRYWQMDSSTELSRCVRTCENPVKIFWGGILSDVEFWVRLLSKSQLDSLKSQEFAVLANSRAGSTARLLGSVCSLGNLLYCYVSELL